MPVPLLLRSLSLSLSHHSFTPTLSLSLSLLTFHRRSMATTTTTSSTSEPISPSNTRVGWIGTGVMGRSMCSHLIKAGYTLTVFNRTLSKAQPLLDMGAHLAHSPLELASKSDVVFSIVGYPSDVRSILLDPNSGALCLTPVTHFHWCRLLSKSQTAFSSLDPWLLTFPALHHCCSLVVVCRLLHYHRYLSLIESLGKFVLDLVFTLCFVAVTC